MVGGGREDTMGEIDQRDLQLQAVAELQRASEACRHHLMFWGPPVQPAPSADTQPSGGITMAERQWAFWSSARELVEQATPQIGGLREPERIRAAVQAFRQQWATLQVQSGLWRDADDQENS